MIPLVGVISTLLLLLFHCSFVSSQDDFDSFSGTVIPLLTNANEWAVAKELFTTILWQFVGEGLISQSDYDEFESNSGACAACFGTTSFLQSLGQSASDPTTAMKLSTMYEYSVLMVATAPENCLASWHACTYAYTADQPQSYPYCTRSYCFFKSTETTPAPCTIFYSPYQVAYCNPPSWFEANGDCPARGCTTLKKKRNSEDKRIKLSSLFGDKTTSAVKRKVGGFLKRRQERTKRQNCPNNIDCSMCNASMATEYCLGTDLMGEPQCCLCGEGLAGSADSTQSI